MVDGLVWHGMSIGDLATWAGAIGSAAAAVAAFLAAKFALKIARESRSDAAEQRMALARTIAQALGYELRSASVEIEDIVDLADHCAGRSKGPGDLRSAFHPGLLQRTHAIEMFADRLEAFGTGDGAALANACTGVLNIRAQVKAWTLRIGPAVTLEFNEGERRGLALLAAEGRMVNERVDRVQAILERFGGGKSQYEV